MLLCGRSCEVLVVLIHFYSVISVRGMVTGANPANSRRLQKNVSETPRTTFEGHLEGSSIIYGLSRVANETLVTEACFKELSQIQQGILRREPWAMKVLDASGSQTPGFLYQNNFWLGSREACATANNPLGLTLSKLIQRNMKKGLVEDVAPFDVEFRVVYLKLHSPWQLPLEFITKPILHVGLCLPASCSCAEVKQLTRELIRQKNFIPAELYEFNADVLYVKDLKLKAEFFERRSFKFLIAVLVFTVAMTFGAFYTRQTGEVVAAEQDKVTLKSYQVFFKCFDIRKNLQQMFATGKTTRNEIPVINGMRTVSAFAIINVHIIFYMIHTLDNLPVMMATLETKALQVHTIPFYLVDAFLTISGFLQTFLFFQDSKRLEDIRANSFTQNVRRFLVVLWHRYLRLAPLYLVTIAVADLVSALVNDVSLFHIYERYDETCSRFWWRNVLFIQSYFPMDELCVNWSWTLSCEMQYFLLASVLLFAYVKHPKLVKCVVICLLLLEVCWALLQGTNHRFQFGFETSYLTAGALYINPFLRGIPYIVGCIAAWYLVEQNRQLDISSAVEKCLWHLATLFVVGCTFSMYWRDLDYVQSICVHLLARFAISLAVCWIVVASATGRGIWWSRLLEAEVLQPVSRLTYAIYLLNPIFVALFSSMSATSIKMDLFSFILYSCGYSIVVYIASIGFSLAFEVPYCNWSRQLLKRNKRKDV